MLLQLFYCTRFFSNAVAVGSFLFTEYYATASFRRLREMRAAAHVALFGDEFYLIYFCNTIFGAVHEGSRAILFVTS